MKRRPNPLPWYYRWRTNLIQTPLFALFTIICGSLSLLISLVDRSGRAQHRMARIWARSIVWVCGSKLTIKGMDKLDKGLVAVYASNHTSYMDTPVIFASLPMQFRILAKQELWPIPFIGWYLSRSGQIPIDTVNTRATLSSLGTAAKALRAGMPLFIFPEGARTPTGEVRDFLSGAAYLAIRAQVPLVPIALSGVFDLLPIHTHHFFPADLTLHVGDPIPTTGMTVRQLDELSTRLREAVDALREPESRLVPSGVQVEVAAE